MEEIIILVTLIAPISLLPTHIHKLKSSSAVIYVYPNDLIKRYLSMNSVISHINLLPDSLCSNIVCITIPPYIRAVTAKNSHSIVYIL